MQPVMNLVGNLGYVAVAISGSILAIKGVIKVGDIQAFIQYVRNLTQPMSDAGSGIEYAPVHGRRCGTGFRISG